MKFNDIKDKYETIIFDLWGVIHDGVKPYEGVVDTINSLLLEKKNIYFMSNAPRPYQVTTKNLQNYGLKIHENQVITSGDITIDYLNTLSPSIKIYHLGKEKNQDILKDINLIQTTLIEEADYLLITAFHDEGEDLEQYDTLLKRAAAIKLPAICANPDTIIINNFKKRYCAGFFSGKYEKFGGKVKYYGKPHIEIYSTLIKRIDNFNLSSTLMVGDTIETDIKGAEAFGIDSALVLTGNTSLALREIMNDENVPFNEALDTYLLSIKYIPTCIIKGVF